MEQEVRLDIILLRPLVGTDNRWSRRGTLVFVGQALGEERAWKTRGEWEISGKCDHLSHLI
jgi:hypothetical protein